VQHSESRERSDHGHESKTDRRAANLREIVRFISSRTRGTGRDGRRRRDDCWRLSKRA
jgi:hypothetical protein